MQNEGWFITHLGPVRGSWCLEICLYFALLRSLGYDTSVFYFP